RRSGAEILTLFVANSDTIWRQFLRRLCQDGRNETIAAVALMVPLDCAAHTRFEASAGAASRYRTGYPAPVQTAAPPVTGGAPAAPTLKWMTPSSAEQKLRTPV